MKKFLGVAVLMVFMFAGSVQAVKAQGQKAVVSFDGSAIAYNVYGQGEPALVLIHGWSCDSRYWDNQIDYFSDRYKVITIDLAGHGDSSQERTDYTMSAFGQDVKAVVEKESIEKAVLIGHSMGGDVIARAALLMPEKVIALVGVDTLHNVAHPFTQEDMDGMLAPFEENFPLAAKDFVAGMFPENSDPALVAWILDDMSSAPEDVAMSAMNNHLSSFLNGKLADTFEQIAAPVFAVNARLWPTEVEENRKHMKSFDVHYIEDSGHFLMQEKPQEFNQALENVIRQVTEQ